MALLGAALGGEVGLQLLLSPTTSSIVIRSACSFVGVAMPVYSTFKALERRDTAEGESWLVYWSAFGCLSIAEIFSDRLLSWFPYYYHAKLIFLIWLQYPNNYGAKHLYSTVLRPFLLAHQATIDRGATHIRTELDKFMKNHQQEINGAASAIHRAAKAGYAAATGAGSSGRTSGRSSGTSTPAGVTIEDVTPGTPNATTLANAAIATAQSLLSPSSENVPARDVDTSLTNSWIHVQPAPGADSSSGLVHSLLGNLRQRGNNSGAGNGTNNNNNNAGN